MTKLYTGLTDVQHQKAFEVVEQAAEAAYQSQITNRFAGTLVALSPHVRPSSDNPAEVSLDEVVSAVAFQRRLVTRYEETRPNGTLLTARDFDEVALAKARDLWVLGPRMGMPYFTSREITEHPELLVSGMTRYVGGIWNRGRVTTFSGVQGDCDIAFSQTFDAWVTAQARLAVLPVIDPSNPNAMIGGEEARDPMFRG
jgi:hypothetical protein